MRTELVSLAFRGNRQLFDPNSRISYLRSEADFLRSEERFSDSIRDFMNLLDLFEKEEITNEQFDEYERLSAVLEACHFNLEALADGLCGKGGFHVNEVTDFILMWRGLKEIPGDARLISYEDDEQFMFSMSVDHMGFIDGEGWEMMYYIENSGVRWRLGLL